MNRSVRQKKEAFKNDLIPEKLPRHVGIIMDGNGRWAEKRGLPRVAGHRAGVESLREMVRCFLKLNIPVLTVYAFSTENWKRPSDEVNTLMELLVFYLRTQKTELLENGVRLRFIGDVAGLPREARREVAEAEEQLASGNRLVLNVALNYGGRAEIVKACRRIAELVKEGRLSPEDINEELFARYLDTSSLPDPDLIIRPAGEMRISNFLLWQAAYSEFWVTDRLWPDFREADLLQALADYQRRERRFGGLRP